MNQAGAALQTEVFAEGLRQPFGIAFYPPGPDPQWVYLGDTDAVLRIPYRNGDLKARGPAQSITGLPGGGLLRGGGHWTRDLAFSLDGRKLFISVGSHSNVDDPDSNPAEFHRADILECDPDGSALRVYAWGLRNPVSLAVHPRTGELWTSVNERDELGNDLPPDYITHVQENGFYGWPWYYIGGNPDPRHPGRRPELKAKVLVPDVLLQPHNASLGMTFYEGSQFPPDYRGDIFAAEHGSWNRATRTGYELIRVPMHQKGRATGEYEDFMTGFVTEDGHVWGRPVGVAVAQDGSLLVSDDGSNAIWRISKN
jgi:glucose/arabinose dehydrogenase